MATRDIILHINYYFWHQGSPLLHYKSQWVLGIFAFMYHFLLIAVILMKSHYIQGESQKKKKRKKKLQ